MGSTTFNKPLGDETATLNSKLTTVKNIAYQGVTIAANSYADVTDANIKNKPIVGWNFYGVASYNLTLLCCCCNENGILIRLKNNGGASVTTGQLYLYYLDV